MKKTLALLTLTILMLSCGKSEKTVENLKKAVENTNQIAGYFDIYAEQATADSLYNLATLYSAAAESKKIQTENFTRILQTLDEMFAPVTPKNTPEESSFEIIKKSQQTLSEQITDIEPEKHKEAIQVITRAKTIEGKLENYINIALSTIKSEGNDQNVGEEWLVCPICGDIYRAGDMYDKCDICGNEVTNFSIFTAQN